MYNYFAYGQNIHSEIPLQELLVSSRGKVDVVIKLGKVERPFPEKTYNEVYFRVTQKGACFHWNQIGTFLVRNGCEITIDLLPGVGKELIRLPLLGMVMAALLYQRGLLILHANVVASNGKAIAFLGGKGWGKSTMAAALYSQGYSCVTDDVAAIAVQDSDNITVFPGFPQIKLWPNAVAALGDDPDAWPSLHSGVDKRACRFTRGFTLAPLPLSRMYVLAKGACPQIKPLGPQEAIVELMHHSHHAVTPFLEMTDVATAHLYQCASLANSVPICQLSRPKDLSALPDVVGLVEEDLAHTIF